jgi:hypothetical protein
MIIQLTAVDPQPRPGTRLGAWLQRREDERARDKFMKALQEAAQRSQSEPPQP